LPRWFHEGVALLASRGWSLEDRSRLLLGGVSGVPASTAELEAAFAGEGYSISTAYAVAGALAQHLVQRHGAEAIAAIAARVRRGEPFPAAFAAATGTALPRFEEGFWRRFRLFYRWLPFLSSGATLWAAVTLLALAAIARRRQRDAAVKRRWDEEERLAAELAALREELHPRRRPGSDESVH
ncbi:MAG TPA: hypothetical protein VMT16_15660, partial [Thermoanaerobaculia bacterium]|nr:hypothetical protein [Thermoanaerobaculia bacterium]